MAAQQEKWSAEHELRRTAWREREAALEQRQHALLLEVTFAFACNFFEYAQV
jgi:hypothetical protein